MLGRGGRRFAFVTLCLLCAACASAQLNYNTEEISATIDSVYTRETLNNLSKFIDDQFAIPSQAILAGGTVQTVNTINPSVTFPFTAQLALAPTGITKTTAGAGASISGTNTGQQNYTTAPLSDANTLRNQQAIYRHAVIGTPLVGNYLPPRIFFQDKFYDDPNYLQRPHCVVCAVNQGVFEGVPSPIVSENNALPPAWLYWDTHPHLNDLLSRGEMVNLGYYGNHQLFMRRIDYANGVLTNFVLFTLPNTEPVEVLSPVVHVTPGTPGATNTSGGGSNLRMVPAARQGPALVIPQGIQP